MRVIECNTCGETISAATDAELTERLRAHIEAEHGGSPEGDDLAALVAEQGYEATDS
jgi:predicted small metal-binding protein